MSFPTYINFQVNNPGGGRSNMVVHSHAVILMLLSLCPESFGIFLLLFLSQHDSVGLQCFELSVGVWVCVQFF